MIGIVFDLPAFWNPSDLWPGTIQWNMFAQWWNQF
ncbi:hypothetical protein MLGJGCBP_01004 [Rhodococcus sp. T7]|nr:hypothetical protein MLGJGCBP_01004 [Rhodococcus sp. T7]